MFIREAQVDDSEDIASVQFDAWGAAYSGIMPEEFLSSMDLQAYKSNWKKSLANPGAGRYIVAEVEGKIVGFSVFGPARDGDLDKRADAELVAINVDPAHWGNNIGSKLLDAVVSEVSGSYRALYLWVAEKNKRARNFYEYHGFKLEGGKKKVPSHGYIAEVRYLSRYS